MLSEGHRERVAGPHGEGGSIMFLFTWVLSFEKKILIIAMKIWGFKHFTRKMIAIKNPKTILIFRYSKLKIKL